MQRNSQEFNNLRSIKGEDLICGLSTNVNKNRSIP